MKELKCSIDVISLIETFNKALASSDLGATIEIIEEPSSQINEFSIYNLENEVVGYFSVELDRAISKSNEFKLHDELTRILESSYDGIWITDGSGTVLYTNQANERLSGIKREEVIGKSTQELMKDKIFSVSATLEVLTAHKRVTIMGYNYKTSKQVLITGNPIFDQNGKIIYVVNNVRDITDLDNLRQELNDKVKIIDQQKKELEKLRISKNGGNQNYVVHSERMREIFDLSERLGKFDLTVLILGESGAGKEVVAESIVSASERRGKPFIRVNCGAIPENLLESELFGYEKGAFTGANLKGRVGMFELANGGTILLDEVADIPLNLQVKLLRVIQGKEILRVGGTKSVALDVRIIAATNKNIEQMVKEGSFREDLYYRLNVASVTVPSLRERKEDVPVLVNHFLNKFNLKHNVDKSVTSEVIDILSEYSWPGNVRELENLIENLVVLTREAIITKEHLPKYVWRTSTIKYPTVEVHGILPLKEAINILEDSLISRAMKEYGTTRKVASVLGVDQSTIVRKVQKMKL